VLELLRELKRESTILFSTHVLHDAEEICDDVLIIHQGQIVVAGDLRDLMRNHQKPQIRLRVGDVHREWAQGLRNLPFVQEFESEANGFILQVNSIPVAREFLLKEIAERRIEIESFEIGQTSLEDLFMKAVQA
jgi:ABC-2 type transport system ATP-binding protein